MPPPERILVRGVNWLGDAVMTTPALLRLRERFPAATISLLTPDKLKDLWLHHPAIDEVIPFAPEESVWQIASRLRGAARRRPFDLAVILPNSPRAALETWLARIRRRIGYARPWRSWFLTEPVPDRPAHVRMHKRSPAEVRRLIRTTESSPSAGQNFEAVHQIYEYLHLISKLGGKPDPLPPSLTVTPDEVKAVQEKFGLVETGAPLVALNPGAEYGPAKRWPAESFLEAARQIQRQIPCRWLILGGAGDAQSGRDLESALKDSAPAVRNLAGQTSLRELCAILRQCRLLVTNDTGPMHVAAALGTPVVVPYGSTSPELTGPGLPGDERHRLIRSTVPCAPCFLRECPIDFRCMAQISPASVARAAEEALRR